LLQHLERKMHLIAMCALLSSVRSIVATIRSI
jgi:hypothetical protein